MINVPAKNFQLYHCKHLFIGLFVWVPVNNFQLHWDGPNISIYKLFTRSFCHGSLSLVHVSVVNNVLACNLCGTGSNPGEGI